MAKKTTWHCDRCGKQFERKLITNSVKVPAQISLLFYDGLRCFTTREYDLCADCIKEFCLFVGGRKLDDGK